MATSHLKVSMPTSVKEMTKPLTQPSFISNSSDSTFSLQTKTISNTLLKIEELQSLIKRFEKASIHPFFMPESLDFLKKMDSPAPSLSDFASLLEGSTLLRKINEELSYIFRRASYNDEGERLQNSQLPNLETAQRMLKLGQQLSIDLEGNILEKREQITTPISQHVKEGNYAAINTLISTVKAQPIVLCMLETADRIFDHVFNIGDGDATGLKITSTTNSTNENFDYMPTEISVIAYMLQQLNLKKGDVFIDLGCGLGRVPILVNLLTEAQAIGVERDINFANAAKKTIKDFNLKRCQIRSCDATECDISDGNVFFLFNPFCGSVLERVTQNLKKSAEQKSSDGSYIRICSCGPCSQVFRKQTWLETMHRPNSADPYAMTIFKSK